jgi:hypothetical protein
MATTYLAFGTGSGGIGMATVTLKGVLNLTGSDPGDVADLELSNVNSPGAVQLLNLSSGANTINATNCPALASAGMVIIVPPVANTNGITLKGASADTGIQLSLTSPSVITFPTSPQSSFVLTAGGSISGLKLIWL